MSDQKAHGEEQITYLSIRVPSAIKEQLKGYYRKRGLDLSNGIRHTLYRLLEEENQGPLAP